MSTAPASPRVQLTPGVVKVRLSGDMAGLDALTVILAADPAVEVLTGPDGPYPNRRDPGHRVYLTVRIPPAQTQCGAAHSRQAIRRPATPSRRHLP